MLLPILPKGIDINSPDELLEDSMTGEHFFLAAHAKFVKSPLVPKA
jgi:hypothetical protein